MCGNVVVVLVRNAFVSRNTDYCYVLNVCVVRYVYEHNPNLLILEYTCSNLLYCDQKKKTQ